MGLFGRSKKDKEIERLNIKIEAQSKRIEELEDLSDEKDEFFSHSIGDGLRHRSSWAAQQMNDKKNYLKGK